MIEFLKSIFDPRYFKKKHQARAKRMVPKISDDELINALLEKDRLHFGWEEEIRKELRKRGRL
jgi:hypothetical protein